MPNPSKAKGSAWESAVTEYLRGRFGIVERLPTTGAKDEGDLFFTWEGRAYVVECKAEQKITLSTYVEEANVEAGHFAAKRKLASVPPGVAIVKRRNHHVGKAYVVCDLETFIRIVKR